MPNIGGSSQQEAPTGYSGVEQATVCGTSLVGGVCV